MKLFNTGEKEKLKSCQSNKNHNGITLLNHYNESKD